MSCIHLERALRLEALTEEERERLLVHVEDCPECGPACSALGRARLLLAAGERVPRLGASRRIWEALSLQRDRPRKLLDPAILWPLSGAVAIIGLFFFAAPRTTPSVAPFAVLEGSVSAGSIAAVRVLSPGDELIADEALELTSESALSAGKAQIRGGAGSRMRVRAPDPRTTELWLEHGSVLATVQKLGRGESFKVQTPEAEIRVVGTRFRVFRAGKDTRVAVEEGVVSVLPRTHREPILLYAGEEITTSARPRQTYSSGGDTAGEPPSHAAQVSTSASVRPSASASEAPSNAERNRRVAAPLVAEVPPAVLSSEAGPERALAAARAALVHDTPLAARLAREVLAGERTSKLEAEALVILADASRRSGDLQLAARLYSDLAHHPEGRAFAEEALFLRARVLLQLGETSRAEQAIEEGERRFETGTLSPERSALAAELALAAGSRERARASLLRAAERARDQGDQASAQTFESKAARLLEQK